MRTINVAMPDFAVCSWASRFIANTTQQRAADNKTTIAPIFTHVLLCVIMRQDLKLVLKRG